MTRDIFFGIRITADGKPVIVEAERVKQALAGIGATAQDSAARAGRSWRASAADIAHVATAAYAAYKGVETFLRGVTHAAQAVFEAGLRAEKFARTMEFAAGSAAAAAREMAYVASAANRIGLDVQSAGAAYAKLSAAVVGTSLAGRDAKAIFEAVGKAATVMGLSAGEADGALLAISQMISKGTVAAEELRGQLGERLPGAFQIAARAMGVTTAELGKMLEQGQVLSEDFLPKFATELTRTLGDAPGSAAASAQAQLNRLRNAWEQLKRSMAESGALEHAANALARVADALEGRFSGAARWAALDDERKRVDLKREEKRLVEEIAELERRQRAAFGKQIESYRLAGELKAARAELDGYRQSLAELEAGRRLRERGERENAGREGYGKLSPEVEAQRRAQALSAWGKFYNAHLSKHEQYLRDLAELNETAYKAGIGKDDARYRKALAAIEEKHKTKAADTAREYDQLTRSLQERIAVEELVASSSDRLTEGERVAIKVLADLRDGHLVLTQAQAAGVGVLIERLIAQSRSNEASREAAKRLEEERKIEAQRLAQGFAAIDALDAEIERQRAHNEEIGLSAEALDALRLARMDDAIAIKERQLALAEADSQDAASIEVLRIEIEQLKQLRELRRSGAAREAGASAAKQAAEDWKRASQEIEHAITDSLIRGFESGKSPAQALRDTVVAMFSSMVLRPVVQAVVQPLAGGVTGALGALGVPGYGQSGGGLGSLLSGASSLSQAYSLFSGGVGGSVGSVVAGVGNFVGSTSLSAFGTGMGLTAAEASAAAAAYNAAGMSSVASSLSSGAQLGAALGPVAVAAAVFAAMDALGAFGGDVEMTGQGVTLDLGGRAAGGNVWQSFSEDGGWFHSDSNWTTRNSLPQATLAGVRATLEAVHGIVTTFADAVGDPSVTARLNSFSASYRGSSEGLQEWFGGTLGQMIATALPGLKQFRRAGEETQQTLARLASALEAVRALRVQLDADIAALSGTGSEFARQMQTASDAVERTRRQLAATSDVETRIALEGQLYTAVRARYELERQYLAGLAALVEQAMQSLAQARAGVEEARRQILGQPVMSAAELRTAIAAAGAGLGLPSAAGVQAAADQVARARIYADAQSRYDAAIAAAEAHMRAAVDAHLAIPNLHTQDNIEWHTGTGRYAGQSMQLPGYVRPAALGAEITASQAALGVARAAAGSLTVAQAQAGATAAQEAYAEALQAFAGDAQQAIAALSGLREETLRYYSAQRDLAQLMGDSAARLAQTVSAYRRANMVPVERVEDIQIQFNALAGGAAQLAGAALAARADQLNDLAALLLDSARETYASGPGYQSLLGAVTGTLDALQSRLVDTAPRDYQAESIALLSGIDLSLGNLQQQLVSADNQVVQAINSSKDSTVAVLSDIRDKLSTLVGLQGQPVRA